MPLDMKRKASVGAFVVDKDSFKTMSPEAKDEMVDNFKRECLIASDDVQNIVDFCTEVVYLTKDMAITVDLTKLQAAITGEDVAPEEDPTQLDYTALQTNNTDNPETEEVTDGEGTEI